MTRHLFPRILSEENLMHNESWIFHSNGSFCRREVYDHELKGCLYWIISESAALPRHLRPPRTLGSTPDQLTRRPVTHRTIQTFILPVHSSPPAELRPAGLWLALNRPPQSSLWDFSPCQTHSLPRTSKRLFLHHIHDAGHDVRFFPVIFEVDKVPYLEIVLFTNSSAKAEFGY